VVKSLRHWGGQSKSAGGGQVARFFHIDVIWPFRQLGEFVTEDKLVMESYNFDHSKILMKWEVIFVTPDKFKTTTKSRSKPGTWDDPVVREYTWIREK